MHDFSKKVAANTAYQFIGKSFSTFLGLLAIAMMTRYLGQEGFGGYATIIAFLQFFGIIIDFGLTLITVQMISEPGVNERKIMSNIFTLRFFSAIIFLGIAPLSVLFFPYSAAVKIGVLVTTLSFLFISLHQVLVGVFQKYLRMDLIALAEIIGRIGLVAGIGAAIFFKGGLLTVMIAVVFGSFLNWLVTFIFSRRFVKISWEFDFGLWKKILGRSWPIGISIVFNLIYLKADTIILSLVRSQAEVGLYGASYRVIDVLTMIPIMVIGVVLPVLTKSWAEGDKDTFKRTMNLSFNILSIIAVPIVFGILFLAEPIMVLVAGSDFAVSGQILKILVFGAAAIFLGSLFGHTVVALNKQRKMIWAYCATAFFSFIGYLIFIPKYSYYGAAGVTVFSEVMIGILTFLMVYFTSRILPSFKIFFKVLASSLVMSFFLYIFREMQVLILILLGGIVYFGSLFLFGGFNKKMLLELVKIKKCDKKNPVK